jgi:tetratricopeptide (TPR) repeat protein
VLRHSSFIRKEGAVRTHHRFGLLAGAALLLVAVVALAGWQYWPAYQLWVARRALAANNLLKAEELLAKLTREDPRHETLFLYAHVLRRLKRNHEALAALDRAVERGLPKTAETRREYGLIASRTDFPSAEKVLRQVLEEQPDDTEALQALAEGYAAGHHWSGAEWAYTRWLALEPERIDLLVERARVRKEAEQFEEAAADLREVLQRAPEHFQARLLLAHCLLSNAAIAEAEPQLLVCQQLRPDRPEPLVGLAICATENGDLDRAHKFLSQARALDPTSMLVLHEQGDLYLLRQRHEQAALLFEQAVTLDPKDKQAHLKLAQALRLSGNVERARQHERRYEELDAQEVRRSRGKGSGNSPSLLP